MIILINSCRSLYRPSRIRMRGVDVDFSRFDSHVLDCVCCSLSWYSRVKPVPNPLDLFPYMISFYSYLFSSIRWLCSVRVVVSSVLVFYC